MDPWVAAVTDHASRTRLLEAARSEVSTVSASARDAKGQRRLLLEVAYAHPRDARIRFDEDTHSYFLDGERVPLSVSGLYMRYFEHFDSKNVTGTYMERWRRMKTNKYFEVLRIMDSLHVPRDRQQQIIIAAWAANGDTQSGLGTALHRAIELFMNDEYTNDPIPIDDTVAPDAEDQRALYDELLGPVFKLPPCRALELVSFATTGNAPAARRTVFPVRRDVKEYEFFLDWARNRPELVPIRAEFSMFNEDLRLAGQVRKCAGPI